MVLEIPGGLFGQDDVRETATSDRTLSAIIKSIQYGTIAVDTTSNTDTIQSVDITSSYVMYLGAEGNISSTSGNVLLCNVTLTNATTVTAARNNDAGIMQVKYVVIEFQSGIIKTIQSGSTTGNATISAVDTDKALLISRGAITTSSSGDGESMTYNLILSNATTVSTNRDEATLTVYFTVMEFN